MNRLSPGRYEATAKTAGSILKKVIGELSFEANKAICNSIHDVVMDKIAKMGGKVERSAVNVTTYNGQILITLPEEYTDVINQFEDIAVDGLGEVKLSDYGVEWAELKRLK